VDVESEKTEFRRPLKEILPAYTSSVPLISVVMPVFNERTSILRIISQVKHALTELNCELIVADDGSTDGTSEEIKSLVDDSVRVLTHSVNLGKGAALRTAFCECRGEIIVIQDADLEYDPRDIPRLIRPIINGQADVVFGSRFHGDVQRVHLFYHRIGNAALTFLSNLMTNLNLSDMECGYKAFRREVVESFEIKEARFGVEPEITAKVAKRGYRIYEVPVSYSGRDYSEGKKIGWKDAVRALWCILRYRIAD
jgi:glycosyltransferase involved in cell wall biosynthesis